jgi:ribosomal protein S18 acetylase RimI-like enzyme
MSVGFEEASDADLCDILNLINTLNQEWFSRIIPKEHYNEPFLTREQFQKLFSLWDFYVLRKYGQIIAVGSFSTRDENTAWIPMMYVHSDYQRKGIGSSLMDFLEQRARDLDFSNIQLETDSDAEWAVNFYKKHGYSVFEKNKNPWGFHIWLEKDLGKG